MRAALLLAAVLLAACATQASTETLVEADAAAAPRAPSGPEAAMAAAAARTKAGQPCHDVPAQAFNASDISSTTTSGGFKMEIVSSAAQPISCSGVGEENTCEVAGEAFVRASVPGLTRHYHIPANMSADVLAGARTLACGMRPAA